MRKNVLNTTKFIEKAKEKHGDKYDYSLAEFTNMKTKLKIMCPNHGEFEQVPFSHLKGHGCSKCSFEKLHSGKILNKFDFIEKAKEKHGDKYDYSLVDYVNNTNKVKIICPIHGKFEQTPHHHKRGGECKKCANIKTGNSAIENSRGWSLSEWKNKLSKKPDSVPILYVIKCFNEEENFFKFGITMRSVSQRFINKKLMPYQYTTLLEIIDSPEIIFNSEIKLKQHFKNFKYKPNLKFSGWHECFNIECEKEIKQIVLKIIKNEKNMFE